MQSMRVLQLYLTNLAIQTVHDIENTATCNGDTMTRKLPAAVTVVPSAPPPLQDNTTESRWLASDTHRRILLLMLIYPKRN
jgi:hypothetical protein